MNNFVLNVNKDFYPQPTEPIIEGLFRQYERIIVESLITSFALDFLVQDKHGGSVDTLHNVRKIGSDGLMEYKNIDHQRDYDSRGAYNSREYHSDARYIQKNREVSEARKVGKLKDSYTGRLFARNDKTDLDHVISAKEIHDDRGRVLAGLKGIDLANSPENLQPTNPGTNRSKKADTMDDYLTRKSDKYSEAQKSNMSKLDKEARISYENKMAVTYYTSPAFAKDVAVAARGVALRMGLRQALGLVFAEIWFSVRDELEVLKGNDIVNLNLIYESVGKGIQKGYENARTNYKELFERFITGAVAGALASITTSLSNIFFTTSQNLVRVVRMSYVSLVEAIKVLFVNPENYAFGERMRSVTKILATGASIVTGVLVGEAINKTALAAMPALGEIVTIFCSTLATGIMACTLLFVLDNDSKMNTLVHALNNISTVEDHILFYQLQAEFFQEYAAELMQIDIEAFKKETQIFNDLCIDISNINDEKELNKYLNKKANEIDMILPWRSYDSFGEFVKDKKAFLLFE